MWKLRPRGVDGIWSLGHVIPRCLTTYYVHGIAYTLKEDWRASLWEMQNN